MNSDKSNKEIDASKGLAPRQAVIVLGLFETPDALLAAIPGLKAKALGRLEAYTPYPIHGLDELAGRVVLREHAVEPTVLAIAMAEIVGVIGWVGGFVRHG